MEIIRHMKILLCAMYEALCRSVELVQSFSDAFNSLASCVGVLFRTTDRSKHKEFGDEGIINDYYRTRLQAINRSYVGTYASHWEYRSVISKSRTYLQLCHSGCH